MEFLFAFIFWSLHFATFLQFLKCRLVFSKTIKYKYFPDFNKIFIKKIIFFIYIYIYKLLKSDKNNDINNKRVINIFSTLKIKVK